MNRFSLQQLIADMDLPNPTTTVPFEKFGSLNNSDDLIDRAAFWCFYAAMLVDKAESDEHKHKVNTIPVAVQARQDGHILNGVARQLHIRDCVLIANHDLATLTSQAESNKANEYFAYALIMVLLLVSTVAIMWFVWWVAYGIK